MSASRFCRWLPGIALVVTPVAMAALPATATLVSMESGDIACYLTLKDERGKHYTEMADFELCESGKSLLGKKVSLTTSNVRVMAASCQGDPNCKKSETRAVVTRMAAVVSTAKDGKATAIAATLCSASEGVVFSCSTGTKTVSVCASANLSPSTGSVTYRFGQPGSAPDIELSESPRAGSRTLYGQTDAFAGGGGAWLRFVRGAHEYVVYTGIGKWGKGGAIAEKAGVSVTKDGKRIAVVRCRGKDQSELGPDWFEKAGIVHRQEEFLFPD